MSIVSERPDELPASRTTPGLSSIKTLLLIEDNPGDARLLREMLDQEESRHTRLTHVQRMSDAERHLAAHAVDIILLDPGLPDAQGMGAVRRAHAAAPHVPLVVLTGLDDESLAAQALHEGAQDYLIKGQIETRSLLRALRYAVERTERKRTQDALEEAQQRLDHVVSSSPVVLFLLKVVGDAFVFDWVSKNVAGLLGYAPEDINAVFWEGRLHPDDHAATVSEIARLFREPQLQQEYRLRTREGTYKWLRAELRLLRDAAGHPVEAVGSWADITARKEAELRLQEREEQYRLLFESNPHPMYVFDAESLTFLAVNEAAVSHYGYPRDEFLRMTIEDIRLPVEQPTPLSRALGAEETAAAQVVGLTEHRRKDGTVVQMDVLANRIQLRGRRAWLGLAMDVTEKRSLEAQLLQAQKMESVGRLAGGVAHDFNNILGVITGYGELLSRHSRNDAKAQRYADDIVKAASRGAALTGQLLAFSRRQVLQPRVLDLNVVVAEMETMLRRLIGEHVQLVTILDDRPSRVRADAGQMEQVLMNLALNARDAMPDGGCVTIRTRAGGSDGDPRVSLSVNDTGHGMAAAVQARLFEPFFTTKAPGKGTGLGLSTVHGIVQQSGGQIAVATAPGKGTTFTIRLPRTEAVEEAGAPAAGGPGDLPRGSETVLLVEDEQSLREIVRECLEDAGYTVLEAMNGQDALDLCGGGTSRVALLITDVVMPGMGGRVLAERLFELCPDVRVLYMSGYTDDEVVLRGVLSADMAFLQKPFSCEALARKVRLVLDS